ncbi:MAG: hypothetical protein CMP61_06595 [Flavobacteriales bacterium]|nr:hypothetical protein [Flavobacteriales bacterium]|tara:strand:- start:25955 stop:26371 length:417 start_codon:yes stop_codon:yes gene_type:complete
MKKIVYGLVMALFLACSSQPFTPNKENELLVGKWRITAVDDAAAMINKEEFILSAMHEKYKEGYVFQFEKGPNFKLISETGNPILEGQYGIAIENSGVTFLLPEKKQEISYDLEKKNNGFLLTVTTPGELVNLTIEKI